MLSGGETLFPNRSITATMTLQRKPVINLQCILWKVCLFAFALSIDADVLKANPIPIQNRQESVFPNFLQLNYFIKMIWFGKRLRKECKRS
jgi:hypothetical protein